MKATRSRLLAVVAVSSLLVTIARADEAAYAKILKARDAVLSEILATREGQIANGTMDEEGLSSARLALWTFRRDTATATTEKTKQQELIVGLYEKRLAAAKRRMKEGLAAREELLVATDALLEAQQTLEEIKLGKVPANQVPDRTRLDAADKSETPPKS